MAIMISRRSFLGMAGLAGAVLLSGCAGGTGSSSSSGSASSTGSSASTSALVVGTLATEDILPLWVAESEGLFGKAGLDVSIVPFQSATELISGVSSGEVDLAMTDIMVTARKIPASILIIVPYVPLSPRTEVIMPHTIPAAVTEKI